MKQAYPIVRRRPSGPSPEFLAWVAQFGIARLARSLGVSRGAVHAWVTPVGKRERPRTDYALDIVALSAREPLRGTIRLTLCDVLGNAKKRRVEVRQ
jgi:hypothetical protein